MSDSFFDKFIADLVKGAENTEGFMRGGHVTIDVQREPRGREEKLAAFMPAASGGAGKLLGMAMRHPGAALGIAGATAGALGGAAGAEKGHGLEGALKGGVLGGGLALGAGAGARHLARTHPGEMAAGMMPKAAALEGRYVAGVKAAAAAFKVKEAFLGALLPLAGSLLGGTALRAGAGALAKGVGGKALGGIASKALPMMGKGIGGMATDMAGSMAGGAIGQKLAPPPPPPPQV